MNNVEKNFSVFSRSQSKKFANEYFLKKIKNNYDLIPDFDLKPIKPESVVIKNDNNDFDSIPNNNSVSNNVNNNIQSENLAKPIVDDKNLNNSINTNKDNINNSNNLNSSSSNINNISNTPNLDISNTNNSSNTNKDNVGNVNNLNSNNNNNNNNNNPFNFDISNTNNSKQNVYNNTLLNKHLNTSANLIYDGDYQYLNDGDLLSNNFLIDEDEVEFNSFKNEFNDVFENDDLEDINDYLDDEIDINEIDDGTNNQFLLNNTYESENFSNLLNSYNIKENVNMDIIPDGFFNYLSKNRIKEIVNEKLGYCDEEMIDELHSISIAENWRDLDVQKWLLNPENINKYKEVDLINNNNTVNDIKVEKFNNHPILSVDESHNTNTIFKSSELDNKLFIEDSNNLKINPSNHNSDTTKVSLINKEHLNDEYILNNINLQNKLKDQENTNRQQTSAKTIKKQIINKNNYSKTYKYMNNKKDRLNMSNKNDKLEKEISFKIDFISNEIKKLNGDFKASMIEELYKSLLINNQTETLKNYINEKIINIYSLFALNNNFKQLKPSFDFGEDYYNIFSTGTKPNNDVTIKKENNDNNQVENNSEVLEKIKTEVVKINDNKINELDQVIENKISSIGSQIIEMEKNSNEKMYDITSEIKNIERKNEDRISNIDLQLKNIEKINEDKFNEINENLKKLIDQIEITKQEVIQVKENKIEEETEVHEEKILEDKVDDFNPINQIKINVHEKNNSFKNIKIPVFDSDKFIKKTIIPISVSSNLIKVEDDEIFNYSNDDIKNDNAINHDNEEKEILEIINNNLINFENKYESLINVSKIEFNDTDANQEIKENNEVLKIDNNDLINAENKNLSLINVSQIEFPKEEVEKNKENKFEIESDYFQNKMKSLEEENPLIEQSSKLIQKKENKVEKYDSNDIKNFFESLDANDSKNDKLNLNKPLENAFEFPKDDDSEKLINEKESLKITNNNYNQSLDSIEEEINLEKEKEKEEKKKKAITETMLNSNEEKISNWKDQMLDELDDVIFDLRDLNIRDDSIHDIENLKLKFKNI